MLAKSLKKFVNTSFNFFRDNLLISANQTGFMPGDSTVNQFIILYHELYRAIDQQKEVRLVFLDISKAFDKVWHGGLLYKLEKNGISANLLSWFSSYLKVRQSCWYFKEGYFHEECVHLSGMSSKNIWNECLIVELIPFNYSFERNYQNLSSLSWE